MRDLGGVTVVGDDRGQPVDQAKLLVGTGQQQNATVGTDHAAIECRGDLLAAYAWQGERQKGFVVVSGHGRFCPGVESGVRALSLCDSGHLYHARQRIPDMLVESRTGAVACAIWHHPVSRPRSSNAACGFPALRSPTGFTAKPATRPVIAGE